MAIGYDFDGTLAPGNMQEHSYLPSLGVKKEIFWKEVKEMAKKQDMDEILAYMFRMLHLARLKDKSFTRRAFSDHGREIVFYTGVEKWFDRIDAYARRQNVTLSHFVISSGLREIIEGTKIAKHFKFIFASGFAYDANSVAEWPALAINYTTKTQYLFRINKGIHNSFDNAKINKFVVEEDRPIPFSNMVYLGDGETDVPCMKMLKLQGGFSVAVFDPSKRKSNLKRSPREIADDLIRQRRADYSVPADYSAGSKLDHLIKAIIDQISLKAKLSSLSKAEQTQQNSKMMDSFAGRLSSL